jgi:YVTN family beta-propeller protein
MTRIPTRSVLRLILFALLIFCFWVPSLYAASQLDRSIVEGPLAARDYWLFESGPVRPLAMSHDGTRLYATNIPDGRLEVFAVTDLGLTYFGSVPVGVEPVSLAVSPDDKYVWVVNHLSDNVSVVDVSGVVPVLVETIQLGDEPRDIVFAGPDLSRVFITTAHRGQNSVNDPQFLISVGRADIWIFDSSSVIEQHNQQPLKVITVFGDTPRALAVSPGGDRVYAAVFRSGNRTTTMWPDAFTGRQKSPPNDSADGVNEPTTGLIVKFDGGTWVDELGRNFNASTFTSLPDLDVFEIDAMADDPVELSSFASVGTTLFNMVTNPVSGDLYVSNTDARNHIRFAGDSNRANSTVRGHLADHRVTVVRKNQRLHRNLNTHLDLTKPTGTEQDRAASLSQPMAMEISSDGGTLYVGAYGSAKVGIYDTGKLEAGTHDNDLSSQISLSGGGPAGLVLDEARHRLFVYTRFDNSVAIVDLDSKLESEKYSLFNPEPESVTRGRKFLYDARLTSLSCSEPVAFVRSRWVFRFRCKRWFFLTTVTR